VSELITFVEVAKRSLNERIIEVFTDLVHVDLDDEEQKQVLTPCTCPATAMRCSFVRPWEQRGLLPKHEGNDRPQRSFQRRDGHTPPKCVGRTPNARDARR
jgi:hypothetical protein